MNGYADTQMTVIKQIQADRRAAAEADRVGADWRRGQATRGGHYRQVPWRRRLTASLRVLTPVARP